jgi:hypothetical protein
MPRSSLCQTTPNHQRREPKVVNYPLDAGDPHQRDGPQYAADDATFKYLSHLYANTHAFMAKSDVRPYVFGRRGG